MALWMMSYVSVAVAPSAGIDRVIAAICAVAEPVNARLDVTGILTFSGGRFMQVIEGPQANLHTLMEGIRRDGRHHSVRIVSDRKIALRRYPDWRMKYREPDQFCRDQLATLRDLATRIGPTGGDSIH